MQTCNNPKDKKLFCRKTRSHIRCLIVELSMSQYLTAKQIMSNDMLYKMQAGFCIHEFVD